MSTTRLRGPAHRCDVLQWQPTGGEVERCDECGTTWLGRTYPNPAYDGWVRLGWLGRKLRGLS